ncbi:amidohydrolase [bacterium]|nr:amidohydrolase [bacterium]
MILIKNIAVLTQNKKREIILNGSLLIDKGKIKALYRRGTALKEAGKEIKIKKIIDGKGKVVMPGLINAHTHLAMTLLRGYADDLSLEDWWQNYVYPIESKFTKKDVFLGSLLGLLEMVKSGTTCFADFYYYEEEVAKAASLVGLRGVFGSGILDLPTFYFKTPFLALMLAKKFLANLSEKKYSSKKINYSLVKGSVAPHMFQTTSLKTYRKSKDLANKYNVLLQTHILETKQELEYSLSKYKKRPVEVLNQAGILDKNSLLAHCCWISKREINILAKSGASVVHCPVSNMKLSSGVMPLPEMLTAGINVSLGTDSACSNNSLDMFQEMKTAALIHKVNKLNPIVANAQIILDMATINGAKALGLDNEIGSIEPGKRADLIILDLNKPHLTPLYNLVSHLVYVAKSSDVETVIVDGKIVMEKRKLTKINEAKIIKQIKNRYSKIKI